jgi:tetratricopeptide (TPR) repeat protein
MRQALLNRSNTFYELNKYNEALADIEAFASQGPDTLITHLSKGLIFTRMNKLDQAVKSFQRALKINSAHAETLVNLATVYYYQKNYDSARHYIHEAIRNDPSEANAHNVYALLELELGNENAALLHVNQALSLRKDDPYFLNNRGFIYIMTNDLEKALSDIDNSIGEDPYNAWAYRNKGVYYLKTNQIESAIRLLSRAEQMDTTVSKLYYYLGEANILNGRKQIGCNYFRKSFAKGEIELAELKSKCGK